MTTTDCSSWRSRGIVCLSALLPRAIVACIATLFLSESTPGSVILFGNSREGQIFEVDPATGTLSSVGATPPHLTGIEYVRKTGSLIGLTSSPGLPINSLIRFDPATGVTTTLGSTGLNIFEGDLAFSPKDGLLYGVQDVAVGGIGPRSFFRLDPLTGSGTILGAIANTGDFSALAFDRSGTLFVLDTGGSSNSVLHTIDPSNGSILTSTSTNVDLGAVAGMAFHPGTDVAYVADGSINGTNTLYTLDPATGVFSPVGPVGHSTGLAGLAFTPEPSPFVLMLPAIGAGLLIRKRSRPIRTS